MGIINISIDMNIQRFAGMKVICTSLENDTYGNLADFLTIGKTYEVLDIEPCSRYTYVIRDDNGNPHDMSKKNFIRLRDINLDKLL